MSCVNGILPFREINREYQKAWPFSSRNSEECLQSVCLKSVIKWSKGSGSSYPVQEKLRGSWKKDGGPACTENQDLRKRKIREELDSRLVLVFIFVLDVGGGEKGE